MNSKCDNREVCSGKGDAVSRTNVITKKIVQARETLYVEQM